jgi:IS4 transposase
MEIDVVEAVDTKANRYFLGTNMSVRPKTILKLYKKRWGIETSYRMIGEFQSKTTSNSYVVRVFYFVLAVLLYNVWVLLNARVKNHVKVVRLKLSCFWSLPPSIMDIEKSGG